MIPPFEHAMLPASGTPSRMIGPITLGLRQVNERVRAAIESLDPGRRTAPRADGGWSALSILEHMALSLDGYLPLLRAFTPSVLRESQAEVEWTPTFWGGLLARSLTMRYPMPAPKAIKPGPSPRPDAHDALIAQHAEIVSLMDRLRYDDWRRFRFTSPFAFFVRPNFGDACVITLRHGERHTAQLERLVRQLSGAATKR
jgi:hypothetical protein